MSLLIFVLAAQIAVPDLAWAQTPATKTITVTTTWVNDDTTVRPDDVTVHIKKTNSVLKTGPELEGMMKTLSGSGSINTDNTTVTAIKQATKAQYDAVKPTLTASNEMQASGEPSYMWYDGSDTIYLYSEADNVYLNNQAQNMCRKFTNLRDISGLAMLNTSRATDMSRMFQNSSQLADLSPLADWDVSHVTTFRFAFGYTSTANVDTDAMAITSLEPLRNWDVSSVADFNQMFKCCRFITTLEPLKDWDTSAATDMGIMFTLCPRLDDAGRDHIKGWDVSAVTNFNGMFNYAGETVTAPIFTNRTGTWGGPNGGDYRDTPPADSPAAPTAPEPMPATETEYTSADSVCSVAKNGNTWTYTFTVPNDDSTWILWEDTGATFNDENGLANAYKQDSGGTQGKGGSEATALTDIKPGGSASFTHTNTMRKEITVTKAWDDKNNQFSTRPTNVNNVNLRLQLNGADVKSTASPAANDITTNWNTSSWTYTFVTYSNAAITDYTVAETFSDARYANDALVRVTAGPTTAGVETGSATVTNRLKLHDLVVKNETTGNAGDKTKKFRFQVAFSGSSRSYAYEVKDAAGSTLSSGTITGSNTLSVDLTDGDYLVIPDVFDGTNFSVTQTTTGGGYTSTIASNVTTDTVSGLRVTGTMDNDRTVTANNNKTVIIPAGVHPHDNWQQIMLLLALVPGGAFLLVQRRQRQLDL